MNNPKKDFGKRLSKIRKAKKLKQEDLKEMIDAPTVQMISGWENGHSFPSGNYLIILSKKLDVSLDYLLLGQENDCNSHKINTYKDACAYILELRRCGLFDLSAHLDQRGLIATEMLSLDTTLADFVNEYNSLQAAAKALRKELFEQALIDLLNKYDIPLNK